MTHSTHHRTKRITFFLVTVFIVDKIYRAFDHKTFCAIGESRDAYDLGAFKRLWPDFGT